MSDNELGIKTSALSIWMKWPLHAINQEVLSSIRGLMDVPLFGSDNTVSMGKKQESTLKEHQLTL